MTNRDESLLRAGAHPPRAFTVNDHQASYPVDPVSGGTWVGVNDVGLTLALLNRSPEPGQFARRARCSRGSIIPVLLGVESLLHAEHQLENLDPRFFDLFQLVMVHEGAGALVSSSGDSLSVRRFELSRPFMVTSSSLGHAVVEGARRSLFDALIVTADGDWLSAQERFHRHRWPLSPEVSVCMRRADRATVSRTTVDVTSGAVAMHYAAVATVAADPIRFQAA